MKTNHRNPRELKAWNDEMARRYDPDAFITKSGFFIRKIEGLRLSRTRKALDLRPTDRFLDLGCGAGNLLEGLEGGLLVGLDLSESLLAAARLRKPGASLLLGNAETLPFPGDSFDRVACSEVLEHIMNPAAVINEIHRVAKPGARVVLTVPNETLINATKAVVLTLGLKKVIAGGYNMSDDMLEEWHLNDISMSWVVKECRHRFALVKTWDVPTRLLPYHRVLAFDVRK